MNELQTQPHQPAFDLSPQTFEQALTFAKYMADSDMVPKDFKGKPGNCLIAMQWGMEVGLKPLQALQNIAVINGRPSIWGDALIALVLASPVCKGVVERYEGTGEDYRAVCVAKRHGAEDVVSEFSLRDAKAAGLFGKQGPWTQYRDRMLKMRARAFALRDQFADVIKGISIAEESMDTPAERHMGMADVLPAEKPASYPADQFEKNLPAWLAVIAKGRKTADDIITMASTKFPLTDEQKAAIRKAPASSQTAADVEVKVSFAQVAAALNKAANTDELADAGTLIGAVADPEHRRELSALFEKRTAELTEPAPPTA